MLISGRVQESYFFYYKMSTSSGINKFPYRIENIPKNSQTYQSSSITCGEPEPNKITVVGELIL